MPNWNYQMTLLAELLRRGMLLRPGEEFYMQIRHEDSCHLVHSRGPCNCDLEIMKIGPEPPNRSR